MRFEKNTIALPLLLCLLIVGQQFQLSANTNCEFTYPELESVDYGVSSEIPYMTASEVEMLRELNFVRSNPKAYKSFILQRLQEVKRDSAYLSSLVSLSIRKRVEIIDDAEYVTIDTTYNNFYDNLIVAINDLLIDLDNTCPMQLLKPHRNLYIAALNHGREQSPSGDINHQASDGSWPLDRIRRAAPDIEDGNENIAMGGCTPREIVMQLLIDSGVPGYGHRYNILNPEWEFVGCREVTEMDLECNYWIQEFGKQFNEVADLLNPPD